MRHPGRTESPFGVPLEPDWDDEDLELEPEPCEAFDDFQRQLYTISNGIDPMDEAQQNRMLKKCWEFKTQMEKEFGREK